MPKLWGTELRVRSVLYFVWVRSQSAVVKFHGLHYDFATLGLKADINSKAILVECRAVWKVQSGQQYWLSREQALAQSASASVNWSSQV